MRPPTSSEAVPLTAVPHAASRPQGEGEAEHATRIRRLFEMTSDLLATISLDGRFTLLNPAWEQALGWSREELTARPMHELIHPDDVEQTLALVLAGSRHPAHLENFTNRYRHRDGSWRWLLWSARCDGDTWYAAAKDVTDREAVALLAHRLVNRMFHHLATRLKLAATEPDAEAYLAALASSSTWTASRRSTTTSATR